MNLRAARSVDGVMDLLGALGYDTAAARPFDLADVGLAGTAQRIRTHQTKGPGVLVAEVDRLPDSLKTVGRRMTENFHDEPLGFFGERNGKGWSRLVVARPRLLPGGGGAVTVARLVVDPTLPTAHDVEVVQELSWRRERSDTENQEAIDRALDVERVTRRFFVELNRHYRRLVDAVAAAAASDPAVEAGVERARGGARESGAERVALRIVTQTLFVYFLQRRGLLEGRRDWLSEEFRLRRSRGEHGFYAAVMEPLFYSALSTPVAERPPQWRREGIPFLNGGLFESRYGNVSLPLADDVFDLDGGVLGFLDGWSFTVSEERADESEVSVDPEMLGKVFENLMAEDERKTQGAVYTPRPVVQFMCREALVPYLQRTTGADERGARLLIDGDDPFGALADAHGASAAAAMAPRVDDAMAEIRVLDPAVGSGAFPLGMLAEIVRLRRHAHRVTHGEDPDPGRLESWRLHAIEWSLFGVDVNPTAIELCRLRLWLALLVDTPPGATPDPLPNLEFRTVAANSLTDFVGGLPVQNTREGALPHDLEGLEPRSLTQRRADYFETSDPEAKRALRAELEESEATFVRDVFERARGRAGEQARAGKEAVRKIGRAAQADLPALAERFEGIDRVQPVFVPAFHAPDVVERGGWDIVIMNPPYLSRKEARQRLDATALRDLEQHHGRTADLMVLFAQRALELVRGDGGVMSMIFNDSIFTSTDAADLRRRLLAGGDAAETTHVAARTKCFEGVAVNGGVVVASRGLGPDPEVRWVENLGRPVTDLLAAGRIADPARAVTRIGRSELFEVSSRHYHVLPHRPLFRPSAPARELLGRFRACAGWSDFSRYAARSGGSWELLSNTRALNRWIDQARREGFYDALEPGRDWVLLGLVIEGGQGLATADDRRFLAALDGTPEAEAARAMRERLEALTLAHPKAGPRYRALRRRGLAVDAALLAVGDDWAAKDLGWPKSGLVRIADPAGVRSTRLGEEEVRSGIADGPAWVPFEKGDQSGEDGGGARWRRDNPIVIDWSPESVALLRTRAASGESYRRPRIQNEGLWGKGGVTWNSIASYLRCRMVTAGGIPGHKTPVVRSSVAGLSDGALASLVNAPVLDFCVRTFLGSRLQIEIGDLRRLPIPVLSADQDAALARLGDRAVAAKEALDHGDEGENLEAIEAKLDALTRDLYGIRPDADLWVAR